MKHFFILVLLLSSTGMYAQKFNEATPACGRAHLTMADQTTHNLFFYPNQVNQQMAAEIGKDVYLLSKNTPFHVLQTPVKANEIADLLDLWQDYQRHSLLQGGEGEFFVFFTNAAVTRTHMEQACPARGSWYALLLQGVPVPKNKALLKALEAGNWQAEVAKVLPALKNKTYTVLVEPLCADEYGGKNCIFIM